MRFFNTCMPVKLGAACLFALMLSSCGKQLPAPENSDSVKPLAFVPQVVTTNSENTDGILVKFRNTVGGASRARSLNSAGLVAQGSFSLVPGLTRAQPLPGLTVEETLIALASDNAVAYAEPDYLLSIDAIPNDPQFDQQYALNNTGQNGGTLGADISASSAWDTQTGVDTIIAVIDTGVDYNHEDLQENIWTNVDEIPGNGIDDDNNGYVDDVRGWNFSGDNNDPMDDNEHGTHASGTIGAKGNNGIGISGVNWNVRIMPLKFMNSRGIGSTSSAISALEYAVNNGARISNNSWGGGVYSQALYDAIQSAHVAGHVFVTAAGNTGENNDIAPHYPSSYDLPNVISVAASDENDQMVSFSNFGALTVDLVAPGNNIYSTMPNNAYQSLSGTSMAAPYVSGVSSLLLAENPSLSVAEIRSALMNSVDQLAAFENQVISNGRLNAQAALASVIAPPAGGNPTPTPGTEVIVNSDIIEVAIGASVQLSATGGTPPYTWSVDRPAYASIDVNSGVLTGLTVGPIAVFAMDSVGTSSNAFVMDVIPMEIQPKDLTRIQLTDTVTLNANGGIGPYSWSVDDATVVEITPSGVDDRELIVTPLKTGFFQVTLSDTTENSATTGVIEVFVPTLIVSPTTASLNIGDTLQLTAEGGTSPYRWTSSDNAVVTVDSVGLITAVAGGSAIVTLTDFENRSIDVSVTVASAPVPALTLTPTTVDLSVADTFQLTAEGGATPYSWSSSNSAVASVNNNGLVSAIAAGSVTITVQDSSGQSQQASISVAAVVVPPLQVTPPSANMQINDTLQLQIQGGIAPYSLVSSDSAIANVNNSGLVTAISAGSVSIAVQDNAGQSQQISITVAAVAAPPLQVSPTTVNLQVNQTQQLQAQGGVAPYNWTSSNSAIASVSISGLITAVSAGNASITLWDAENSTQIVEVTVTALPVVNDPVTIIETDMIISIADQLQLSAVGGDQNYNWSSSNPVVADITTAGFLTAFNPGFATMTVTDGQGASASITVEVRQLLVTAPLTTIAVGDAPLQLNSTGGAAPINWSVDNTAFATIDNTGLLTPVAAGVVTVTATDNGGFSGTINITINGAPAAAGGHHH